MSFQQPDPIPDRGYVRRPPTPMSQAVEAQIAGRDLQVPIRLAGKTSRQHDLLLRFDPVAWDGGVHAHLVAAVRGERLVARYALSYDPVAEQFTIGDLDAVEDLLARLDILSGVLGGVSRSVASILRVVIKVITAFLLPRFFVIGSVGGILLAYGLYYFIVFAVATKALFWIILPGAVLGGACHLLLAYRMACIQEGMYAAVSDAMAWTGHR